MDMNSERARLLRLYESDDSMTRYYDEAVPLYEKAIEENPLSACDLFDLAFLHERRAGRLLGEARALYERALKVAPRSTDADPNYFKVLNHLTRTFIHAGMTHSAVQYLKELIQSEPDNVMTYLSLCNCYMVANQPDDAEKAVEAARKLDGDNAYVLYYAGEIANLKGRHEEALACWRQSFALDDTLCDNLYSIAFLLGRLGRYEEAVGAWEDVRQSLRRLGCDIEEGMVDKEIEKLKRKIPPATCG